MTRASTPKTATDKQLYRQTCAVHAAMSERLERLWDDDEPLINGVECDAAFVGTMTALFFKALFLRTMLQAINKTELSEEQDRIAFLQFAGGCWDDWSSA
jgi:hypothetical protein